jgi:methyl-accepting chemotaxis protein
MKAPHRNGTRLTISLRVGIAFGLVLTTIGLLVGAVLWQLSASIDSSERMGSGVSALSGTSAMNAHAKNNAISSMVILLSPSESQRAKLAKEIAEGDARIRREIEAVAAAVAGSAEKVALLDEVRKRHATQMAGVQRIIDLVQAGKQAEAAFSADEEMIPMMAPFLKAIAALDERQFEVLSSSEGANRAMLSTTRNIVIGSGLLAALLAAASGFWLVRSVTRPLKHAVAVAERVAAGDLTARAQVDGRDEVAQLLAALNRMTESLSAIVTQVRQGSEAIAASSNEIAAGNADLSQRTEQAAGHLQTTAASMEELTSTVRHAAESARSATQLASGTEEAVAAGGSLMTQAMSTMDDISTSSKRIAEITGVIDGIAFQTNILALNAAVEAARAGEQGRGFAVVAAEVRLLAQRSATAAREVRQLIEASASRISQGATLVKSAGERVDQAVGRVRQMTALIGGVSDAAQQQAQGIDAVNQAVSQLDEVTQRNAALVEQSAAAAEGLSTRAQELVQTVGAFRIDALGRAG